MKMRKAMIDTAGLVVLGLGVVGIAIAFHTFPVLTRAFDIGTHARVYVAISDHTSNIVPILSSEWDGVKSTDVLSCLSYSSECGSVSSQLDSAAREMRSMLVLYKEDGTTGRFGTENRGDRLRVTLPAPNGRRVHLNFVIPFSLSTTESIDSDRRLRYGDCMAIGESEYARLHLTEIEFIGRRLSVHRIARDDFLAVSEAIGECTDAETQNYDFWREEDLSASGTYACRVNTNKPSMLSMHAYGLAVDINPTANPNCPNDSPCGGRNVLITDIPQCVIDSFKSNNFEWGGYFDQVKDSMHFEWRDPNVYNIRDAVMYASEERRGDEL